MKGFILAIFMVASVANAKDIKVDMSKVCRVVGPIDEIFLEDVLACKSDIVLIHSGGGSFLVAQKIKLALKGKTLLCSNCQSMAALIFSKHKGPRYLAKRGVLMFHQVYYNAPPFSTYKEKDLLEIAEELRSINKQESEGFLALESEIYLEKIKDGDWYPTRNEIKKFKLTDGFYESKQR